MHARRACSVCALACRTTRCTCSRTARALAQMSTARRALACRARCVQHLPLARPRVHGKNATLEITQFQRKCGRSPDSTLTCCRTRWALKITERRIKVES
eukprot:12600317-Alexandrium_andersonii.AAC.1